MRNIRLFRVLTVFAVLLLSVGVTVACGEGKRYDTTDSTAVIAPLEEIPPNSSIEDVILEEERQTTENIFNDDPRNVRGSYVEYIYLTNAAHSFDPVRVNVGDEFLGLKLLEPIYKHIVFWEVDDIEYSFTESLHVAFEGSITLRGELRINDYHPRVGSFFYPYGEYLHLLPDFADSFTIQAVNDENFERTFMIFNYEYLKHSLGLEEHTPMCLESGFVRFENLQVTVENYTIRVQEHRLDTAFLTAIKGIG